MELQEKEFFMREALKEAQKAYDQAEVPIGAVVVLNGEIIGRGHNLREKEQDATLHAEIKAIRQANQHLGSWRHSSKASANAINNENKKQKKHSFPSRRLCFLTFLTKTYHCKRLSALENYFHFI